MDIFISGINCLTTIKEKKRKKKLDGKFLDLLVVCDASDGMRNDLK